MPPCEQRTEAGVPGLTTQTCQSYILEIEFEIVFAIEFRFEIEFGIELGIEIVIGILN